MKTFTHLYDKIYTSDNLHNAWRLCKRGKADSADARAFGTDLENNLARIREDLKARTWSPGGYTQFYVSDPKRRLINAPVFHDRIVHRAVYDVLLPIFEPRFIYDSYACRKEKGTHAAIRRLQKFMRSYRPPPYYYQADIKSYFASIDHEVLLAILSRTIADPDILALLGKIVDSYHESPGVGIPLGNLTSQLFANIVLNELDTYVKHTLRIPHYLRYMDDFVILSDDKRQLWQWRDDIAAHLDALRLRLHPRKQVVAPARCGIDFLGYVTYPDHIGLRNRNIHRFYERLSAMEHGTFKKDPLASVMSWMGYSIHGDACRLNASIAARHPIAISGIEKFYVK